MNFTPGERRMIRFALIQESAHLHREARSRAWYSERWARTRATYRDQADAYAELAKDERLS